LILLGKRVLRPNAMPVPSAPQQLNFPRTQPAAGLELFTSRMKREPTPFEQLGKFSHWLRRHIFRFSACCNRSRRAFNIYATPNKWQQALSAGA